jgi:hypothetical protein
MIWSRYKLRYKISFEFASFLVRLITLSNLNRFTRSDHRWNRIIEYYILTCNRLQKDRLQPVVDRFFDFSRKDATCNWSVAEARQLATAVRSFSVRLRSGCGLFAVLQLDFETLTIQGCRFYSYFVLQTLPE